MKDPLKQFIGTLYFSPDTNERGQPVSKYEGVVVGFVVLKDSGEEVVVRDEHALPYRHKVLKQADLDSLKLGDQLLSVIDNETYTVMKVFPIYGDVWAKNNKSGITKPYKYTDFKKITSAV